PDTRSALPRRGGQYLHGRAKIATLFREMRELFDDAIIGRLLERNDQRRQVLHRLPPPREELRLVSARTGNIDLGFFSDKAQREPFLLLAAVTPLPRMGGDILM